MGVLSPNIVNGVMNTSFYPPDMPIPGSINRSSGNVPTPRQMADDATQGAGESGNLPALWWLGIVIVLVALRLAYEYS